MDLRPERRMMSMTFLSLLIHVIGSLETAANLICAREFENKRLIWPEKSTNITHNVQSRFWYKGEILVSWVNELGFKEGKDYEGRLRHVGDGNIEIKNVTRNDSGIYQSTSQFRGVSNTSTASVNLQVIDAPANTCKPVISHEGSNLKANLPSVDVCTTSQLRLEWIGTNKTVTTQNGTTILDLGTDSGGREYMVCAVGEATKCFQGNMSDFCTNYTVPQHQQSSDGVQSGDGVTLFLAVAIPITLIVIAVIIFCVLRHKGIICKKSSQREDDYRVRKTPEIIPLLRALAGNSSVDSNVMHYPDDMASLKAIAQREDDYRVRKTPEIIPLLRALAGKSSVDSNVMHYPDDMASLKAIAINIFVYDEQLPRRTFSVPEIIPLLRALAGNSSVDSNVMHYPDDMASLKAIGSKDLTSRSL